MLLYAERYSQFVASLPFVITNRRIAMTPALARRIRRACSTRSNPTDLGDELAERASRRRFALCFSLRLRHAAYDKRPEHRTRRAADDAFVHYGRARSDNFTAARDLLVWPRDDSAILFGRHLVLARVPIQLSPTERDLQIRVSGRSYEALLGSLRLKILSTVWSNELNAPDVSVNCSTTSMDDPAFAAACGVHSKVVDEIGMERVEYMWCDNPNRDENGCCRRYASLNLPLDGAIATAIDYISSDAAEWTSVSADNRADLAPLLACFAPMSCHVGSWVRFGVARRPANW